MRRLVALVAVVTCALGLVLPLIDHATRSGQSAGTIRRSAAVPPTGRAPDHAPVMLNAALFPTGLAPGTCIRYRPLRGDRHTTVFVDAGHGGLDPGAEGTTSAGATVDEKDLTLATALALLPLLRDDGYTVVLSRGADTVVARLQPDDLAAAGTLSLVGEHLDVEARIACANASGAQALVALHFDAYDDPSVGGAETLYDAARPFGAANARLAALIQRGVVASLQAAGWPVDDRGATDDSTAGTPALTTEGALYGHLLELGPAATGWLAHPSAMPGVLTEPLFLTDPQEADIAASAPGQRAIARGIMNGLDAYFVARPTAATRASSTTRP